MRGTAVGSRLSAAQVVVGPGAKPALFFPTLALVRPGDEVIYPDPGFPTYSAMIHVAGGTPVPVPLSEEQDFAFDLEALDRLVSERTRLIILNSPSNPTGGVMPLAALEHIAALARDRDLWVLSDEIYARMAFDGAVVPSIAALPGMAERTIICDGFSKTYAMTGWRLGYGIMPEALAERVELLLTHSVGVHGEFHPDRGCASAHRTAGPGRRGRARVSEQAGRDRGRAERDPGVRCRKPQGAFYVFPNISSFGHTSDWLADYLLQEAGVALLSGTAFGAQGEGYLRLCYANSMPRIREAVERMAAALARLG